MAGVPTLNAASSVQRGRTGKPASVRAVKPSRNPFAGSTIKPMSMERFEELTLGFYSRRKSAFTTLTKVKRAFKQFKALGLRTTADLYDDLDGKLMAIQPRRVKRDTKIANLSIARMVCNHGADLRHLPAYVEFPSIPKRSLKKRGATRSQTLSREEVQRLRRYLEARKHTRKSRQHTEDGDRLFGLFAVIAMADVRPKEAICLQPDDIDLKGRKIHIRSRDGLTFSNLAPWVPISRTLAAILKDRLSRIKGKWLFPGKDENGSRPWDWSTASNAIAEAGRAVGIRGDVSFHLLHHFYAENAAVQPPEFRATKPKPRPMARRRIVLPAKPDDPLVIDGEPIRPLKPVEFGVLWALKRAGKKGLTMKELKRAHGGSAHRAWTELRNLHPVLCDALPRPGPPRPGEKARYYFRGC
jgi:hypothetical protein